MPSAIIAECCLQILTEGFIASAIRRGCLGCVSARPNRARKDDFPAGDQPAPILVGFGVQTCQTPPLPPSLAIFVLHFHELTRLLPCVLRRRNACLATASPLILAGLAAMLARPRRQTSAVTSLRIYHRTKAKPIASRNRQIRLRRYLFAGSTCERQHHAQIRGFGTGSGT